jgi:Tol biopolymer transport system component
VALPAESQLGPYVVVAPLGAGGMGEVYRARDPRLGREVALKVLPDVFARDPDRLARFEREVRTVAALSDPHIVAVYDVGRDAGVPYFAAELVEGTDLRQVMAGDRLPLRKVLDLASQIAAGLAAAHARGVVHRDLKPENVLVSTSGHAKIADFGLAKHAEPDPADPTLTEAGTVMGTIAYMSPEQAAGRAIDSRSDQFSFGALLYELLTGRAAFKRPSTAETLAAILHEEPEPPDHLNPEVPAPLAWVLDRCLAKDPADRYGSTEDLVKDLRHVRDRLSTQSRGSTVGPPSPRRRWPLALSLVAAAGAVVLAYWMGARASHGAPARVLRTNIDLPAGVALASFNEATGATLAFSPDGASIVMVGEHDGQTELYIRSLNRAETRPVAGTSGARGPFFSPDGQWLGFWAGGRLRKTPLAGGGPAVICDAVVESGAVWMPDDTVLFSTGFGLLRVSAQGGQPVLVTTPDASTGEYSHVSPSRVPGTNAVLFSIKYNGEGPQASGIGVLPSGGHRWATLRAGAGGSEPKFLAPGFLVLNRSGVLQVASFDATGLTVKGAFTPLEAGGPSTESDQTVSFDVAGASLVYAAGQTAAPERGIYSVDLHGTWELLTAERKPYWSPAVSPDGSRLAVNIWVDLRVSEVWVLDLVRRTWLRLTTASNDWQPVWKDHQTLIVTRGRQGGTAAWDEYSLPATGNGSPVLLASFPHQVGSHALAPDHREVVFSTVAASNYDLWLQPLGLHDAARPLLTSPADEQTLTQSFSPDGHWLAYWSNATGRDEVYVTDFPGGRERYPVSTGGGLFPCWSRDGRRIFYWRGRTVMAVTVHTGGGFAADTPQALFESPVAPFGEFDVSPDGSHFYVIGSEAQQTASPIVFVSTVTAELEADAGTK